MEHVVVAPASLDLDPSRRSSRRRGDGAPLVWQASSLVDADPQTPPGAPPSVDGAQPPVTGSAAPVTDAPTPGRARPTSPTIGPIGGPPVPRAPWHPIWYLLGVVLLALVTLVGAAGIVRAPYVVYAPGSAVPTEPALSVPGSRTYEDDGSVLFLTVSLRGASRQVGYVEAAVGWLRPTEDVFPRRAVIGDQTGPESREQSLQVMAASQEVAAKVALERLGYEVPEEGRGAAVISTVEGSPVATAVQPGDVIVGVDGNAVEIDSQLRQVLEARVPGDEVTLEVERGGEGDPEEVPVELIADPNDADRPVLGVSVFTRDLRYVLPFSVRIDTEDVGGPSAGLALTLGLLDLLTPGSLTGGETIATTGSIDPDGVVGEVGGVAQKAVAAERAGARLILVPEAEADDARRFAGDVEVVGVSTLDDALEALAAIGGNALELGRPGG